MNQVELHPRFAQSELRGYHAQHGIATEAWSPIGQGQGLLDDPALADLAAKYGRTPAQIVLRWHVQLDNIVFPKSMRAERMRENIDVFDFELSPRGRAGRERPGRRRPPGPGPRPLRLTAVAYPAPRVRASRHVRRRESAPATARVGTFVPRESPPLTARVGDL